MKVGDIRRDGRITKKHLIVTFAGVASFAQERIFLDEKVRFSNKVAIYNELIILRLAEGRLSTDRLEEALRSVLTKHKILRTSLIFNDNDSILKQYITDNHQAFTLIDEQTFDNENELHKIIYEITVDANLFDLSTGRVFHCQILRQKKSINSNEDYQMMSNSDILILAFHHAEYDRTSFPIFFNDLCMAYKKPISTLIDEEALNYIDYSAYERLMDMTISRDFWRLELEGYNLQRPLSLPVDRHRSSADQSTGLASAAEICFDQTVLTSFLTYASSYEITPFQLGLAAFYAFLFKLSHGETDLCLTYLNANRYRTELQTMIGMFVATLPYRIQLDSQWSFETLVKYVREKSLVVFEHARCPLQYILADSFANQSNIAFLETAFDFITVSSNIYQSSLDGAVFEPVSLPQWSYVTKFDFMITFVYDSTVDNSKMSCHLTCSRDLYDDTTVAKLARRFEHFFVQIFSSNMINSPVDMFTNHIDKLSVLLPDEISEMTNTAFIRRISIADEGMSNDSLSLDF